MASSQKRANPRREFRERKRLSHVIIRAKIQTLDPIFNPVSAGEHKNGQAGLAGTKMPQNRDAIHPWQVQIEHQQVIIEFSGHGPGLLPIAGYIHCIMFGFQALAHKAGQSRIVFRN